MTFLPPLGRASTRMLSVVARHAVRALPFGSIWFGGGKVIAFSASDILKLLEQIPVWKSLVTLPRRLAEVEARVKALEATGAGRTGPKPNECPACAAIMVFVEEKPDPIYGVMGVMRHVLRCDGCGQTLEREYTPGKGYG